MTWFEQVDVRRRVEIIEGRAFVVSESEELLGSVTGTEELCCSICGAVVLAQETAADWESVVEHGYEESLEKMR